MDDEQAFVPSGEFSWFMKPLIYIGGGDPETLARCPKAERDHILLLALIPICVFLYQAGIYGLTAHYLFAVPGTFRLDLVLIGVFLAAFFLVQDVYAFNRAGAYTAGAFELGLPVSPAGIAKAASFAVIRLAEAVGISQLCAIFFALILFGHDITVPLKKEWLHANATLIAAASEPVDAEIRRRTELVTRQTEVVAQLGTQVSALQQRQVDPYAGNAQMQQAQAELNTQLGQKTAADDALAAAERFASDELAGVKGSPDNSGKPGAGPRRAAALERLRSAQDRAKSVEANVAAVRSRIDALRKQFDVNGTATKLEAHDQLPGYEQSLAEAREKLNTLEGHLRELINGRDAAIQLAVERAPDYVPYDDGLLHRVVVLEQIVNSDSKVFLIVILIDLAAMGLELAGVLAKLTVYIPSSHNARLVRDTNVRIDDVADSWRKRSRDPHAGPTNPSEPLRPNGPPGFDGLFTPDRDNPSANDNVGDVEAANVNEPPTKRKRGRPHKYPLASSAKAPNGQGQ